MRDAAGKVGVLAETDRVQIPVPAGGHKSSATRRKRHAKVVAEAALTDGDEATRAVEEAGRVPEGLPVEWHAEIGAEPLLCYGRRPTGQLKKHWSTHIAPPGSSSTSEGCCRLAPVQAVATRAVSSISARRRACGASRALSIKSAVLRPAGAPNEKMSVFRLFSKKFRTLDFREEK